MRKNLLVVLVVGLFVFAGCGTDNSQTVTIDTEKIKEQTQQQVLEQEQKEKELESLKDFYNEVNHANYKDVLDKSGNNLYYFYQETCSHCNDLKPTMKEFNDMLIGQDDINLYFVDMLEDVNKEGWSSEPDYDTQDIEAMKEIEDIKIVGTPTMIYVSDHEVKAYELGGDQIKQMMEYIIQEYNI